MLQEWTQTCTFPLTHSHVKACTMYTHTVPNRSRDHSSAQHHPRLLSYLFPMWGDTHTHRKGGGVRYKKYPENRKIQNSMTAMRAQEGMEVKRISDVELTELKKRKGRENQSYKRSYSERTDAAPVCVFHCALGVIVCNGRTSNHLRQRNTLCWIHACLSNHSANRFINQTTFDCTGHSIRFIYTI